MGLPHQTAAGPSAASATLISSVLGPPPPPHYINGASLRPLNRNVPITHLFNGQFPSPSVAAETAMATFLGHIDVLLRLLVLCCPSLLTAGSTAVGQIGWPRQGVT